MQLSEAASRLLALLDPEGVLIGGICGAVYGVERFTPGVDIAAELDPDVIVQRLHDAGIASDVRRSSEPGDLSWVVHGAYEGIDFQVLPASETGISPARFEMKAGLRIAIISDFITSKCIAAGQQDMHDVAALSLMHPELEQFSRDCAAKHGCLEKLESWLDDQRLKQRYNR
ncbi:hypothetical protein Ga0123462_1120 [Mariprofundus ferrinatatus]|uniref:Nucleotidyl transferase AbiEii toxin, Type IV TA system n=1 Tax=Mariprofundus ferrinatatus TaxID=1921087 RepID=A0A2K8LAL0_9PROT|nr:hypothetical protein [Mariprofundus ferrinatatus]ATX81984.1 hypothetical protein Ga0123462_1120 [Mariprofundus ferrinatatus]